MIEDPIPWLAQRYADWSVLHTYRHRGPAAAIAAINCVGGCEDDPDGVRVTYDSYPSNRKIRLWRLADLAYLRPRLEDGTVTLAEYEREITSLPHTVHLMRDVLDWAAGRLDDTDWAQLDAWAAARWAGVELTRCDDLDWHRRKAIGQLTDTEQAAIARGQRAIRDAETAMRALVDARLHTTDARPGDQLDLFATP